MVGNRIVILLTGLFSFSPKKKFQAQILRDQELFVTGFRT